MSENLAPALDGGLTIIETLAECKNGMGFNEIVALLPQSRATVVRLLKVLQQRGYVVKDPESGLYGLGLSVSRLMGELSMVETLARVARPEMEALSEASGNTIILFLYDGKNHQSIAKALHPASIVMQEIGGISNKYALAPWGWIFCAMEAKKEGLTVEEIAKKHAITEDYVLEGITAADKNGFAYDDCKRHPGVRRIAVPVCNSKGKCIGSLAAGGTVFSITDDNISGIAASLSQTAARIANLWNQ